MMDGVEGQRGRGGGEGDGMLMVIEREDYGDELEDRVFPVLIKLH